MIKFSFSAILWNLLWSIFWNHFQAAEVIQVWFHVLSWFPGIQNLDVLFGKFTVKQVLKSFSGRNNSQGPFVFGFCNSLSYGLEKSRELRILINWVLVNMHSKIQNNSANNFFCFFCAAIMDLLSILKYFECFLFLISHLEEF